MDEKKLSRMTDNIILMLPLYHRKLLKPSDPDSKITPLNPRFKVLGMLLFYGPHSMSEMGERLFISKPNMTALVDSLIEEGLVRRENDANDRRTIMIHLSPKGKTYLLKQIELIKSSIKHNIKDLDKKECEKLSESFENIVNILSRLHSAEDPGNHITR